jgi:hypothetical protein
VEDLAVPDWVPATASMPTAGDGIRGTLLDSSVSSQSAAAAAADGGADDGEAASGDALGKRRRSIAAAAAAVGSRHAHIAGIDGIAATAGGGPGAPQYERYVYQGVWKDASMPQGQRWHRRIDITMFAPSEVPYALIGWTGCTLLNRGVREYASRLGFDLGDYAMIANVAKVDPTWDRDYRHVEDVRGNIVPCRSEFDVFSFLGLRYLPPTERDCFVPTHEVKDAAGAAGGGARAVSRRGGDTYNGWKPG